MLGGFTQGSIIPTPVPFPLAPASPPFRPVSSLYIAVIAIVPVELSVSAASLAVVFVAVIWSAARVVVIVVVSVAATIPASVTIALTAAITAAVVRTTRFRAEAIDDAAASSAEALWGSVVMAVMAVTAVSFAVVLAGRTATLFPPVDQSLPAQRAGRRACNRRQLTLAQPIPRKTTSQRTANHACEPLAAQIHAVEPVTHFSHARVRATRAVGFAGIGVG